MTKKNTMSLSRAAKVVAPTASSKSESKRSIQANSVLSSTVKTQIVQVALIVFAKSGFEGGSIGEIARRCEISTPLIHYHFASKIQLWHAAVLTGMQEVYRELGVSEEDYIDLDEISRFKLFIRRYINLMFRKPHTFSIILKESDISSDRFEWIRDEILPPFFKIWVDKIAALKSAGLVNSQAPNYHISQVIVGACTHFVSSRYRVLPVYNQDPDNPQLARQHADLVLDIVLRGILG